MSADQAGSVTKPARSGARPFRHVTDGRVLAHRKVRRSGGGRAGRGRRSDRRPGPRRPTSGTCVRRASRWSRPWARPSRSRCSSCSDATRACTRARCIPRRSRQRARCDQRGGDEQRRPPARPSRGSSRAPAGTPGHGGRVAPRARYELDGCEASRSQRSASCRCRTPLALQGHHADADPPEWGILGRSVSHGVARATGRPGGATLIVEKRQRACRRATGGGTEPPLETFTNLGRRR